MEHRHPQLVDGRNVAPAVPPAPPPVAATTRRRQIYATLALALVVVTVTAATRPRDATGLYPHRMWNDKAHWQAVADVVITGDSRTAIGVSPEALARPLGDVRARNFAFEASGYSPQYLAAIEEVFDPAGTRKTVVMGITPLSLTPSARKRNGFQANRVVPPAGMLRRMLDPVEWWFSRMDTADLRGFFFHRTNNHTVYNKDGWAARWQERPNPDNALGDYLHFFDGNTVAPDICDEVCRKVADWTSRGIRVYGFRPPTCRKMIDLEARLSGFDEAAFVRQFEAAGGVWLTVDPLAYPTYDGSHLNRDGAISLSGDLGRMIAEHEAAGR